MMIYDHENTWAEFDHRLYLNNGNTAIATATFLSCNMIYSFI